MSEEIVEQSWGLKMTEFARRTENPLRKIWEAPKIITKSEKEAITLQIGKFPIIYKSSLTFIIHFLGDPTIFKNFKAARESVDALKKALEIDSFSYTVINNNLLSINSLQMI